MNNEIFNAARLTDGQIGEIVGNAMMDDSVNREIDVYRWVTRAAEDHAWHSRDDEVGQLQEQLDELRRQLDGERRGFIRADDAAYELQQERDAARGQVADLVRFWEGLVLGKITRSEYAAAIAAVRDRE